MVNILGITYCIHVRYKVIGLKYSLAQYYFVNHQFRLHILSFSVGGGGKAQLWLWLVRFSLVYPLVTALII